MLFDYVSKEEFAEIRAEEKYEQGLEEGALKSKLEIAKSMKEMELDIDVISKATGLDAEQIEAL